MDILFFAAIAFLVFFKLRKQFGVVNEEEKKRIEEVLKKSREAMLAAQQEAVENMQKEREMRVVNPINSQKTVEVVQEIPAVNEAVKNEFLAILAEGKITSDFFLNGVKTSFEMVLEAFAEGDVEVLQNLLSEKIFQNFSSAISQRKAQNQTLTTNLIAIEKAEIFAVNKTGNVASIVMRFASKQINYISDAAQNIVKGSKTQISEINDVWTFEKDLTSPNPTWFVVATHA
jgi:predicted lipid-binding transport protein (Tim44 family)